MTLSLEQAFLMQHWTPDRIQCMTCSCCQSITCMRLKKRVFNNTTIMRSYISKAVTTTSKAIEETVLLQSWGHTERSQHPLFSRALSLVGLLALSSGFSSQIGLIPWSLRAKKEIWMFLMIRPMMLCTASAKFRPAIFNASRRPVASCSSLEKVRLPFYAAEHQKAHTKSSAKRAKKEEEGGIPLERMW